MKLFSLFLLLVCVFLLGAYTGHNNVISVLENQHNIVNVIEPVATYRWMITGFFGAFSFYRMYYHWSRNNKAYN